MTTDVTNILTNENKIKILNDRITQFAGEIYQYKLNKKTAEATGMEKNIESAENAIQILTKAIEIHQAELETIPSSES
jgi:hypothetical protein